MQVKKPAYRERAIAILHLDRQIARIDQRIEIHEANQPAFPTEKYYILGRYLEEARTNVVIAREEVENMDVAPKNLLDRLVIAVAEWALKPTT